MVAEGHYIDVPDGSAFSSAVSLQVLCMLLFIAELNGIEIWDANNDTAYLETLTSEYACIVAGPEFGALEGHLLLIHKALYGLRSSGAR